MPSVLELVYRNILEQKSNPGYLWFPQTNALISHNDTVSGLVDLLMNKELGVLRRLSARWKRKPHSLLSDRTHPARSALREWRYT